jgi:hypothetical protein
MMRRAIILLALCVTPSSASTPADVRVGVFGLFHPTVLVVSAAGGVVGVRGDRQSCVLRGREEARLAWNARAIDVSCASGAFTTSTIRVTGSESSAADLELRVPGRIARRFHGVLDVSTAQGELVPVMSMPLEIAVASVVAAEQNVSVPIEALKAQAVAARSFFIAAGRRHRGFEFCDTTHCQFLREPPAGDQPATRAARETAGLVLSFRGAPVAAFYSASCGGSTRTLAEAGLQTEEGGYPYFRVACASVAGRHTAGDRRGHGVGLCQEGAAAMAAEQDAPFAEILQHYYPGTALAPRSR